LFLYLVAVQTVNFKWYREIPKRRIMPSVAPLAKIFPLWLKHTDVITGGSSPRGSTLCRP
jgi:hypothetical protein